MWSWIKGVLFGAGVVYLYDPVAGRYRRARLRDQAIGWVHRWQDFIDTGVRDLRNRYRGALAEASARMGQDRAPDDVIQARIRSAMGHVVSHPGAIDVSVDNGHATLRGAILSHELRQLLSVVRHARGVRDVTNELESHEEADVPELQGGSAPRGQSGLLGENWSPGARLVASGVGLMLIANCVARRTPSAIVLGTAGFVLFGRATADVSVRELAQISSPQRFPVSSG